MPSENDPFGPPIDDEEDDGLPITEPFIPSTTGGGGGGTDETGDPPLGAAGDDDGTEVDEGGATGTGGGGGGGGGDRDGRPVVIDDALGDGDDDGDVRDYLITDGGERTFGDGVTPPPNPFGDDTLGFEAYEFAETPEDARTRQIADRATEFAMDSYDNFSRWDTPLMERGLQVIDDRLARIRRDSLNAIDARAANRGIVGSSMERELQTDLAARLNEQANEYGFNLAREAANTYAADRATAADIGLATGGFAQGIGTERFGRGMDLTRLGLDENYRSRSLSQQDRQFLQSLGLDTARFREGAFNDRLFGITAMMQEFPDAFDADGDGHIDDSWLDYLQNGSGQDGTPAPPMAPGYTLPTDFGFGGGYGAGSYGSNINTNPYIARGAEYLGIDPDYFGFYSGGGVEPPAGGGTPPTGGGGGGQPIDTPPPIGPPGGTEPPSFAFPIDQPFDVGGGDRIAGPLGPPGGVEDPFDPRDITIPPVLGPPGGVEPPAGGGIGVDDDDIPIGDGGIVNQGLPITVPPILGPPGGVEEPAGSGIQPLGGPTPVGPEGPVTGPAPVPGPVPTSFGFGDDGLDEVQVILDRLNRTADPGERAVLEQQLQILLGEPVGF